jgi:hypothetical protein
MTRGDHIQNAKALKTSIGASSSALRRAEYQRLRPLASGENRVDPNTAGPSGPDSGWGRRQSVSVELQEVVGGRDQAHSERAAARPLRLKRSIRRLVLIWANTGSTMHWRFE